MSQSGPNAGSWRNAVVHAAHTDIGMRRANNQDSLVVALAGDFDDWQRRGHLFMVADGMGAHAAGELASKIACETIPHNYRKLLAYSPPDALRRAMLAANTNIHERGQSNAEFEGMGTTASALVLLPDAAVVAHVGDSRVYRLRRHTFSQLTFDHSLVWEMIAAGQLPKGDVANFIPKNIITRSLGPHANVVVDLEGPFPLETGDVFLLCTDGLTGQVKDEELGAILAVLPPEDAVAVLVDIANLRGGPDNITAMVVQVTAASPSASGGHGLRRAPSQNWDIVRRGSWAAACILALATLLCWGAGESTAAGFAAVFAALAATLALACGGGGADLEADDETPKAALGTGPHASHDSRPTPEGAAVLCQMSQQLRELAEEKHYKVDWNRFRGHTDRAQAALVGRDFAQAMRQYALSIRYMMSALRCQQVHRSERDSSVLDI